MARVTPGLRRLRRLSDQVIVITGASSGIGLATAREAARRGARLVLVARREPALQALTEEVWKHGGQAMFVVADVGREEDVRHVAQSAIERFGGFDTWINNAGISIFGHLEEVRTEDHRRLFETNFWGVVYGSLAAAEHLKRRGGALINVGCVVSDGAMPLQGMYAASKHAVKGFTDAIRMELEEQGAPVAVTLIKPGSLDTPFAVVAQAILHAAAHPQRELFVGGSAKLLSAGGHYMRRVLRSSLYTKAAMHRKVLAGVMLGAGVAAALVLRAFRKPSPLTRLD